MRHGAFPIYPLLPVTLRSTTYDPSTYGESKMKQPDNVRTFLNDSNKKNVRTEENCKNIEMPERFYTLETRQQQEAVMILAQVRAELRQYVMDEWDMRCMEQKISNPAGYLFSLLISARNGKFIPFLCLKADKCRQRKPKNANQGIKPSQSLESNADKPLLPEEAKVYIDELRAKFPELRRRANNR